MTASEQRALLDGAETRWSDGLLDYGQPFPLSTATPVSVGLVSSAPEPLAARTVRRTVDILVAVVGLIMMAPVLLALIVAIKLDSKGPALFWQRRVGRDGVTFTIVKFRTMFTDAEHRLHELESHNESVGGVLFKMHADPRVTRVGAHLRRLNVDEVPQLLNVLRGDMSLVGPRPLALRDSRLLSTLHPFEYRLRHVVQPGMTGEWQIERGADSDYWHMLQLDRKYLSTRCLRHDALLALKTIVVLLKAPFTR